MLQNYFTDAKCVSLPDDKNEGLAVIRPEPESVLVPFRENVTLNCNANGRRLRNTASSSFRQCVYDPKPVSVHFRWHSVFHFTHYFLIF